MLFGYDMLCGGAPDICSAKRPKETAGGLRTTSGAAAGASKAYAKEGLHHYNAQMPKGEKDDVMPPDMSAPTGLEKLRSDIQSGANSDRFSRDAYHASQGGQHFYASAYSQKPILMKERLPHAGMSAAHVERYIKDQNVLDFQPRLNTSSYVNVTFEEEELKVATLGMTVNLADQTIYPQSFLLHNTCINMLAHLWNCPKGPDFEKYGVFAGAGTVGSTEGCLLAGLALKFRWRAWYAKTFKKSKSEVLGTLPNLVISTQFQAAWEKFFKYMDVEARLVPTKSSTFTIDPSNLEKYVDERTIGVVCIMGNHYGGQYDPVLEISRALSKINKAKGYQVGIHVDGASGGFIAPFQHDTVFPWDFRVPNVLSISTSGHKFGESVCGTGWVVWRRRQDLSSHVAIDVSYLGGHAESYTLNFSRPATGVYVQLYKFLRLGYNGYKQTANNMLAMANTLRNFLKQEKYKGKPRFVMLDAAPKACLPVVTAMLNPACKFAFDDIDLQHVLAEKRWYVSGYNMRFHDPNTGKLAPLFVDQSPDQTMFRVVVKANVTADMMAHLMQAFKSSLEFLDKHFTVAQKRAPVKHASVVC